MELENNTAFQVMTMLGEGPGGRQVLTVIVKGTFEILPDAPAKVAQEQIPVAFGDEFYDQEGIGSVRIESDMVPFKPRADIVLVGRAYAPRDQYATSLDVSLRVGHVSKSIRVFGDRRWKYSGPFSFNPAITDPEPFQAMDLVYERSFGGIDHKSGQSCWENLAGRGFFAKKLRESIQDALLPNLEDPFQLIKSWDDHPKPAGFGFYGQNWKPRSAYLGTVDENWAKERSPRMPADFQFDFYNGAHPDLQVPGYLRGDETVSLKGLTPSGYLNFQLPGIKPAVTVFKFLDPPEFLLETPPEEASETPSENEEEEDEGVVIDLDKLPKKAERLDMKLDTLCLLPDENRFYQVWRGLCPVNDVEKVTVEVATIRIELGN